jgi:hypothetical protein|tara:strand:- start:224 stop:559 length:336 start_codon:yes stop_codon:yes gene_type:complete
MDDEGRWIDSNLILRELQAPQTSRAQLRQWCRRFVKLKAWWQSRQCGLAPSSIHGLAAIVSAALRGVCGPSAFIRQSSASATIEALSLAPLQGPGCPGARLLAFLLRLCAG